MQRGIRSLGMEEIGRLGKQGSCGGLSFYAREGTLKVVFAVAIIILPIIFIAQTAS